MIAYLKYLEYSNGKKKNLYFWNCLTDVRIEHRVISCFKHFMYQKVNQFLFNICAF